MRGSDVRTCRVYWRDAKALVINARRRSDVPKQWGVADEIRALIDDNRDLRQRVIEMQTYNTSLSLQVMKLERKIKELQKPYTV